MAFNVSYIFSAIDKFSAPLAKADKAVDKLDKNLKQIDATQNNVQASASGLIKKIGGIAAAYVSLETIKSAIDRYTKFEDALLELSAITGAAGADLDRLSDSAFNMGKKFARSGVDTLEAFKLVASAKPELLANIPALEAVTAEVLKLSAASGVDLATAANYTAQSLNIFGAGADQAARFVNVLAAESKLGASEVFETGEALLKAGPSARVAGLNIERTTAAIEMLALGGLKGSEAGNALNSIFIRLQKSGTNFKKESLDQAFGKIKNNLDKIKDPAERATVAAELFGLEHLKAGEILMANVGKMNAYEQSITGTKIAQEQADIRLQAVSARFASLGTALDQKLMAVMKQLSPLFEMVATQMEDILATMTPDAVNGFAAALTVLAIPLQIIGLLISGLVQSLLAFFDLLSKVGKAIGLVFAEIFSGGKLEFFAELKNIFAGMPIGDGTESTINVNINDKGGNVGNVSSSSSGNANVNVGKNMAGAGG